jgi:hypothetical protein
MVRLSVNNENARTILPKENAFKSFLVVFIASDTNSGKTACFYKSLDEVNADYTIALGFYKQVKVHVFSSGNWHADSLCAIGEHNDEFEIKSTGINDTIKILIDPFDVSSDKIKKEGYFSWKIVDNPVNDLVSTPSSSGKAQMTIAHLPGTSSYFKEIKFLDSDSEFDFIDSIPLETGIYNVSFEFGKTDFSYVKFSEILYIAPGGAVSYYEYAIPALVSTKVSVTYNFNYPNPYNPHTQIEHLGTFPVGTTADSFITYLPSKTTFDPTLVFNDWYKDAAGIKKWYSYDRVLSNPTILYAKWDDDPNEESCYITPEIVLKLKKIPAGLFTMGSPETETGRQAHECPQHSVTFTGFYMSKYEITQEQYQAVTGTNPSNNKTAVTGEASSKLPVERVNYYDAIVFCNKLSMLEGLSPVYTISGSSNPAD